MAQVKTKVLIVDDNPTDRLILKTVLEKLRFSYVQEAEDGAVAQGKINTSLDMHEPFGLVLLDWRMPRKDGLNLLKFIKSEPKMRNAVIIIMTGTSEQKFVEEVIALGVNDFIVKPFDVNVVEAKIKKLL